MKNSNFDIFETAASIATKFCTAINHRHQVPFVGGPNMSQTNSRWRLQSFWKIETLLYVHSVLTDFEEIWHSDASCSLYALLTTIDGKQQKSFCSINHNNIDIQAMLLWLILPFYDFAVFDLSPLTVCINCSFFTFHVISHARRIWHDTRDIMPLSRRCRRVKTEIGWLSVNSLAVALSHDDCTIKISCVAYCC